MEYNDCRFCILFDSRKTYCTYNLAGIECVKRCPISDVVPITREVNVIHGEIDVKNGTVTYHPPNIDVVPVIRCRDCKHRILNEYYDEEKSPASLKAVCDLDTGNPYELGRNAEDDDWFCADGERKDDGNETKNNKP